MATDASDKAHLTMNPLPPIKTPATLMGLPPEVRANIVQALLSRRIIYISVPREPEHKETSQKTRRSPLALALVNKELHYEVLRCLRQQNVKFACHNLPSLIAFLRKHPEIRKPYFFKAVRELEVLPEGVPEFTSLYLDKGAPGGFSYFPNIEKLGVVLNYNIAEIRGPEWEGQEMVFAAFMTRRTLGQHAWMVVRNLKYAYERRRLDSILEIECCVNGVKECVASIKEGNLSIHQIGFAFEQRWKESIEFIFQLDYLRYRLANPAEFGDAPRVTLGHGLLLKRSRDDQVSV